MDRRQFLATASSVALAGCATSSDDEERRTEVKSTTATPTPTETTTVSEPDAISLSGSGDTATDTFDVEGGFTVVKLSHNGDRNFITTLMDNASDGEELLANHIGSYAGNHPLYVPQGTYLLNIEADGGWEATVEQPRPSEDDVHAVDGANWSSKWPNYAGPFKFEGTTRIKGDYQGDSNFAVHLLNINGENHDLLFNEIGSYSGSTAISTSGYGWIYTEAIGEWSIELSN